MKKKIFIKNECLGFTLIEIIIVLAIAAILIAVIFSQASKAKVKSQVNQMQNNLSDLKTGIQSLYQNDPNKYNNINVTDIANGQVLPSNLSFANGIISNQFGGQIQLYSGPNGIYFTIAYTNVPTAVCVGLSTAMSSGDFNVISAGQFTIVTSDGTIPGIAAQPKASVSNINTGCAGGLVNMNFYAN